MVRCHGNTSSSKSRNTHHPPHEYPLPSNIILPTPRTRPKEEIDQEEVMKKGMAQIGRASDEELKRWILWFNSCAYSPDHCPKDQVSRLENYLSLQKSKATPLMWTYWCPQCTEELKTRRRGISGVIIHDPKAPRTKDNPNKWTHCHLVAQTKIVVHISQSRC